MRSVRKKKRAVRERKRAAVIEERERERERERESCALSHIESAQRASWRRTWIAVFRCTPTDAVKGAHQLALLTQADHTRWTTHTELFGGSSVLQGVLANA